MRELRIDILIAVIMIFGKLLALALPTFRDEPAFETL